VGGKRGIVVEGREELLAGRVICAVITFAEQRGLGDERRELLAQRALDRGIPEGRPTV
jgi:hypothetical protein